ncbi:hypothetical protein EYF80_025011 [Liparis tanakae]|uniref:Uncharacterized protein n=1 Tax=Liparis tanakae TaxID=230148 RepID=A0A4Z2HGG0_9TELE|nr:hypothetical protein EYF80_025011 [Liparis tanakae]
MERVVLSSDGWTQLTERICIPVFPHALLQFCHSPVTQLEDTTGQREGDKTSDGIQHVNILERRGCPGGYTTAAYTGRTCDTAGHRERDSFLQIKVLRHSTLTGQQSGLQ